MYGTNDKKQHCTTELLTLLTLLLLLSIHPSRSFSSTFFRSNNLPSCVPNSSSLSFDGGSSYNGGYITRTTNANANANANTRTETDRGQTNRYTNTHTYLLASSWSCTASFPTNDIYDGTVCITEDEQDERQDDDSRASSVPQPTEAVDGEGQKRSSYADVDVGYDRSSPREWMEYLDRVEGRAAAEGWGGTGGAYTVCRCDLKPSHVDLAYSGSGDNDRFTLWGEEFHLERLYSSYTDMQMQMARSQGADDGARIDIPLTDEAIHQSKLILQTLIRRALSSSDIRHHNCQIDDHNYANDDNTNNNNTKVIMLTLFWTPAHDRHNRIIVRGHALCSDTQSPYSSPLTAYKPAPIDATIALPPNHRQHQLPSRHDSLPNAKLSSWCRTRRPLEHAHTFRPPGATETLLARPPPHPPSTSSPPSYDKWELLEGLTTNLFVLYRDGTLRTPPIDSVLGGYARRSVLQAAARMGLSVEERPVLVGDGVAGEWEEVFVTSAVRVIVPMAEVWVPEYGGEGGGDVEWKVLWSVREGEGEQWRGLYENIVGHHLDGE